MFIYKITNLINEKAYIGQTVRCLEHRWSRHLTASEAKNKVLLYKAIRKYGRENFKIESLCQCESKEILDIMETFMITSHKTHMSENGYNMTWGGEGSNGYHHTEEAKEKLRKPKSEEHKQKLKKPKSEDHKRKISKFYKDSGQWAGKNNPNYGKHPIPWNKGKTGVYSEESLQKIRDAAQKRPKKIYVVTDKDGKRIIVNNLKKFCEEHNLHYPSMINVAAGRKYRPKHKGWKCEYYQG